MVDMYQTEYNLAEIHCRGDKLAEIYKLEIGYLNRYAQTMCTSSQRTVVALCYQHHTMECHNSPKHRHSSLTSISEKVKLDKYVGISFIKETTPQRCIFSRRELSKYVPERRQLIEIYIIEKTT